MVIKNLYKKILSILLSFSMISTPFSQNVCLASTRTYYKSNINNKKYSNFKQSKKNKSQMQKALKLTKSFISKNSSTIIITIAVATLSTFPTINVVKNFSKIKDLFVNSNITINQKLTNLIKILFGVTFKNKVSTEDVSGTKKSDFGKIDPVKEINQNTNTSIQISKPNITAVPEAPGKNKKNIDLDFNETVQNNTKNINETSNVPEEIGSTKNELKNSLTKGGSSSISTLEIIFDSIFIIVFIGFILYSCILDSISNHDISREETNPYEKKDKGHDYYTEFLFKLLENKLKKIKSPKK